MDEEEAISRAENCSKEYLSRANYFREEAERIRFWRDKWIAEGRPEASTSYYLYNQYKDDDGEEAIRACETAAEGQEQRAREVYEETLEEFRRQEEADRRNQERLEGQEKADEILDEWLKRSD
ncbi:MAG: hypothetical protein NTZ16_11035 [Verrucomicrobia bacterium]|nr:hypothetical protein [Verrucomicrobiota bacterium]